MNHLAKRLIKKIFGRSGLRPGRVFGLLCFLLFLIFTALPVKAQADGPVIIRDTEIENILKKWSAPVIKAAGLSPEAVNIILVQNRDINAFVAGGQNIFLYSGLLETSESPGEVIGVIAHELGHIRGGHLVTTGGAMKNASYETMLGTLLGIGAAIVTGRGDVGSAIARGAQGTAMNRFLSFSRVQESSADQAALTYLKNADLNPEGLVSFMKKMQSQELLPASQQNEYMRTHPLTENRIDALQAGVKSSSHTGETWPPSWREEHDRMLAKLKGFITPERVAWDYDDDNHSVAAEYARAIAAYRQNRVNKAIEKIDALINREPDNPYFKELKGQMLVDFGRVGDALPYYRQAVALLDTAPLIRTAYAHALIESAGDDPALLEKAIKQLEVARQAEPRSARLYRLLATAHGRRGEDALAKLYIAEEALLKQDHEYARRQARLALPGLEKNSAPWLRAQDILGYIEQQEKEEG